jgi:hypothetical protein
MARTAMAAVCVQAIWTASAPSISSFGAAASIQQAVRSRIASTVDGGAYCVPPMWSRAGRYPAALVEEACDVNEDIASVEKRSPAPAVVIARCKSKLAYYEAMAGMTDEQIDRADRRAAPREVQPRSLMCRTGLGRMVFTKPGSGATKL